MFEMPKPSLLERGAVRVGELEREALLEGGDSIDAPSRNELVDDAGSIAHEFLAMAERQVVNIADD